MLDKNYPPEPTDEAKVDSTRYDAELIGENELGTVHLHGPYGNLKSNVRIAYLIGMHPMESKAHRGLFDTIVEWDKKGILNYSYYVYNINVIGDLDEETEGRMDGQLLAQEFVAPHIISNDYDLFIDVHSNKGTVSGTYEETNFVFAVGKDEKSEAFVSKILNAVPELVYYFPNAQSSPPYITLLTEQAGIPTVNYETYSYESPERTYDLVDKLVDAVDNLEF